MDRYWVGGTGTWDATTTTNWSATSGGAGGASAPTSADDVYFDDESDAGSAFTVTLGTGAVCKDLIVGDGVTVNQLDQSMTMTRTANGFIIHGNLFLPATNFSVDGTLGNAALWNFDGTGTFDLTTNGVALGNINFSSATRTTNFGSALTSGSVIFNGQVNTNNFNWTFSNFNIAFNSVTTMNWGSSTLTGTGFTNFLLEGTNVTITLNAGTSNLNLIADNVRLNGLTFHNVSLTAANITGANTFNDLTFTSLAATGIRNISVNANQTINGTLTFGTANTAIRRMFVRSDVIGTARTLTAATVATLADVDFRDIEGAGLGTWSGTRLGNCGGNSGITFDAGKDVYRVGTGNWSATQWSLTSGGSVDVNNFPLAQDTAIFDTGTTTGTHTIDAAWNIGNLDMSALNVAVTLATGVQNPNIHGDVTLDADVTLTGAGTLFFNGASNQTVTSAGVTFTQPLHLNKPTTTSLILGDALTSNLGFTLTKGTLDLNDFDLTCLTFTSDNANTRSIAFGTSSINLTGNNANILFINLALNFTYTGAPTLNSTYSGSVGTRSFVLNNFANETNALNLNINAGSDSVTILTHFNNLNFTGFAGILNNSVRSIYGNVTYSSSMTLTAGNNATTFAKSTGTQTLTTNSKTLDFPVTKSGAGTLQLLDNTTIGSTRTLAHTAGTIDLNDNTLTTGVYSATGSTARSIDFGTGTLGVGGNFTASGSNYTTTGTGSVSMTSASGKTFAGGGFTYPTLNQGGAGTLTITSANTFNNISNTNATASTITFPANTITRVLNMKLRGSLGNLVSMRSSIDGTTYTIQT